MKRVKRRQKTEVQADNILIPFSYISILLDYIKGNFDSPDLKKSTHFDKGFDEERKALKFKYIDLSQESLLSIERKIDNVRNNDFYFFVDRFDKKHYVVNHGMALHKLYLDKTTFKLNCGCDWCWAEFEITHEKPPVSIPTHIRIEPGSDMMEVRGKHKFCCFNCAYAFAIYSNRIGYFHESCEIALLKELYEYCYRKTHGKEDIPELRPSPMWILAKWNGGEVDSEVFYNYRFTPQPKSYFYQHDYTPYEMTRA